MNFNDLFVKYLDLNEKLLRNFSNVVIESVKIDKKMNLINLKLLDFDKIDENCKLEMKLLIKNKFNVSHVVFETELIKKDINKENSVPNICGVEVRKDDFLLPRPDFSKIEVFIGQEIKEKIKEIVNIKDINSEGPVAIWGDVFEVSEVLTKKKVNIFIVKITDYTSSVSLKMYGNDYNLKNYQLFSNLKVGQTLFVNGNALFDSLEKEIFMSVLDISLIDKIKILDNSPKKRVELHLHSSMSAMDGITPVSKFIEKAYEWGHKAIAITDHGVVQAFPEAMHALKNIKKKHGQNVDFKVIYGVESYFVNDTNNVSNVNGSDFNLNYVCFDLETTGFSAAMDRIIEIGAVKLENVNLLLKKKSKLIDFENNFECFVDPMRKIPARIVELTGITNEMIRENAVSEHEAVSRFVEFCGENPVLVAHNAQFDLAFLKAALVRNKINFEYKYIDTLSVCKSKISTIKNYKLGTIAQFFGIGEFNAHRACDDSCILAMIFLEILKIFLKEKFNNNSIEFPDFLNKIEVRKEFVYHQILLVKNKVGLKNLYKLISEAHLKYFYKKPRIPKSVLSKYREGLVIGSGCEAGEVFNAIKLGKSFEELQEIARFYDFLEIQPVQNNQFLLDDESVYGGIDKLKEFNIKIFELGKSLGIPVVATGDVHFLNPEDSKFRQILQLAQGYKDVKNTCQPYYFKNTKEMIEDFLYLGEKNAFEVVVTNSLKIADIIENVIPIPEGVYPPEISGAQEELIKLVNSNAKKSYGEILPEIVANRLAKELESITKYSYSVLYMVAKKLVEHSENHGFLVGSRGSVGSSFVAFISGISEVNPLIPHYICPNCKKSEFIHQKYGSGFDLPKKKCPNCGCLYYQDGHDIPFETFLGFEGNKTPDIDLNFSGEYQALAHKYTEEIFGKKNVFKAGTISTIAEKSSIGFVKKVIEETELKFNNSEQRRLALGCTGIKRTTGQHPGGMIVVPNGMEIYDFCPVQHPANDQTSDNITTHFDFHAVHDTICKLDELGHDVPTIYKYLEEFTGIPVQKVNMSDKKVMSLFTSTKALGISPDEINSKTGTFSLPEVGTAFVRQMLVDAKPKTFADLVQISGLSHGTCVWHENARDLIKKKICNISEVIGTRDSIMTYLISKNIDKKQAFNIMEIVRKGKAASEFTPDIINMLKSHDVPDWYINSCIKIKYMFPKAHAVAYMISTLRLAWYKVYYPLEYYAAYFTVRNEDIKAELVSNGREAVQKCLKELEAKGRNASLKERASIMPLQILNEAYARNIKFLPVDIYKSDAKKFLIQEEKIRLPLLSFEGLGETVANNIQTARTQGEFMSMLDFRDRTKTNKTVTDLMKSLGILKLQESNQISFF
ncbi:MAG: PolC-type DNA polymerase III [Candidatus Improbicoccus devescovinae]|nr:MAG: PolC-type DNA polymerase III [Candidatus Improbicoccus devescovinae]